MCRTCQPAFWVDQLCINQSDLTELGNQVALMRCIYRKAQNVYIWLGQHYDDTFEGIQFAKRLAFNVPFSTFISPTRSNAFPEIPFHQQQVK